MPELKRSAYLTGILGVVVIVGSACHFENDDEIFLPVQVSVTALRWHASKIPDRLLELRGFYSLDTSSGSPRIYSSAEDAYMWNDAEGFPVFLFENNALGTEGCGDGYIKAYGFLDKKSGSCWVFTMVPYDENWQEGEACWLTDYDWRNDPTYSHLIPDALTDRPE